MKLNSLLVKVSAVIAVFTLLMILTVGSTFLVARSQQSDAQVIDLAAQQRLLINKVKATSQQLVVALESESDSEEFHRYLRDLVTVFDANLTLLMNGGTLSEQSAETPIPPPSPDTYRKLALAQSLWKPYRAHLEELLKPDVDIVSDRFYDATLGVVDAFEPLAQASADVVPEFKAESAAKSEKLKHVLLISLLITFAVALLSWFYVRRWIVRPITELARGIHTLSSESDLTQHVPVRSGDEIGQVAGNFNRMTSEFRAIVGELSNTTDRIDKETDNISAIAEQTKNDVERQHLRLESVATAVTELAASAHSVIDTTATAVDVTSETAITAQQGQDEAQVSSSVLDTMVESVKNTGVQMEKLQKNAQDIGAIVDVIRGIAEQTNLLALNAAIEAARAGENGRGFAVVADEVRSLAQRTQQSTIEIQDMIAQLQSNTEKASIHIQDGQVKAEDSASHMLTLSQSLLSMVHSVSRIKELNTSIAAAAREQGSVTDEISEKITAVSDGIGQSSHYAENTAETGRMLSELSGELRQRMRQFKT